MKMIRSDKRKLERIRPDVIRESLRKEHERTKYVNFWSRIRYFFLKTPAEKKLQLFEQWVKK